MEKENKSHLFFLLGPLEFSPSFYFPGTDEENGYQGSKERSCKGKTDSRAEFCFGFNLAMGEIKKAKSKFPRALGMWGED